MTITKLRPTFTLDQDRLDALHAITPEAFADGKINWEALREALGDRVEDEGRDGEHFGLFWPGKRQARRLASTPSAGTLRPAPGEGVNEATTRHLFIEGDNLEVLKLLQKSYAGRVKIIYIDPPYNTGNDFIYSDNFTQPLEEYLRATGQTDEMGRVLVTNTQAGGRYHSNWLNMMYPRLRLARNLLRQDGAIFVSIDDHEISNLRALMNEVFGEEAFIADIAVVNNLKGRNDRAHIATAHEHLLFYANPEFISYGIQLSEKQVAEYGESDEAGDAFQWRDLRKRGGADTRAARPQLWFPVYLDPTTGEVDMERSEKYSKAIWPMKSDGTEGCWRWSRTKVAESIGKLRAFRVQNKDRWNVNYPVYLEANGRRRTAKPKSIWLGSQYSTDAATKGLRELIPSASEFTPKAVGFCRSILEHSTESDDIVVDFFAGSATLAQAMLELNRDDEGERRFIMVQLPEPTPPDSAARRAGYATIADIGKERIRRVIKRMQAEDVGKLTTGRDTPEDLGFRVFKLDRSHYKAWRDFEGGDVAELQTLFDRFESPLVEGWKPADVLVEVMLMEGFPLDSTTEALPQFAHNGVTRVSSDLVAHRLYVCLDERVHDQTIADLKFSEEDIFICLDAALSDEAKVRLEDGRRVRVI